MIKLLNALLTYGIENKIIVNFHKAKSNLALLFNITNFDYEPLSMPIDQTLKQLLDMGYKQSLFSPNTVLERDAFEAHIFDQIMPSPSETKKQFKQLYKKDYRLAVNYLYQLSKDTMYIKTTRINQNINWIYKSSFGDFKMTINLSKPEKDPKDIAKAIHKEHVETSGEPLCILCKENEQRYENAKKNLRIVPITLNHETWHFQFSPYAYFKQHAIILSDQHTEMKISVDTFNCLFDFVDIMPDYLIGSNADIPIVGGSILNHNHYQVGRYTFPIESARVIKDYALDTMLISHLNWPLSTLRCVSKDRGQLITFANHILSIWKRYTNEELDIIAHTTTNHQTITPILRKENEAYILYLILRNNRTSKSYPDGIFHPHPNVQHIKKENIGLIEAMGLAILPGRLKKELMHCYEYLSNNEDHITINKHKIWLEHLKQTKQINSISDLYQEVGLVFENVLIDSGVFKLDQQGIAAMDSLIKNCIKTYRKVVQN